LVSQRLTDQENAALRTPTSVRKITSIEGYFSSFAIVTDLFGRQAVMKVNNIGVRGSA